MNKKIRLFFTNFIVLLILSGCSSNQSDPQTQRNNFDECRLSLVSKLDSKNYNDNKSKYDSAAEQACSPLLKLDSEKAKKFVPKSLNTIKTDQAKSSETVSFKITHGPWSISDSTPITTNDSRRMCTGDIFNYPYGESVRVFNEKNVVIGIGKVDTYLTSKVKSNKVGASYESEMTCIFQSKFKLNISGNYFRVSIAGTWWNDLTPMETLASNKWELAFNSDDY